MMTVYSAPSTRAIRVIGVLEEVGAKAEIKSMPYRRASTRRLEGRDFLAAGRLTWPTYQSAIRFIWSACWASTICWDRAPLLSRTAARAAGPPARHRGQPESFSK